jgi:poly(hydroxyalkanoate) depolymerase family esterase
VRRVCALALAVLAVAAVAVPRADAAPASGTFTKHALPAAPDASYPSREYWLYEPSTLGDGPATALVVFLHGCTQSADEAARGVGWNELAEDERFVVAYPEQLVPAAGEVDGSPARCWNSGQAAAFPRGQGELESVAQITRAVAGEYGVDPSRTFILGISSGALMTNVMMATYPDLYAAFGSIAGCSYLCSDPTGDLAHARMGEHARVVPGFVVTGSADYLTNPAMGELTVTQWLGTNDLADDGAHNASVPQAPATVEHRHLESIGEADPGAGDACARDFPRNPCPLGALGIAPYPATVRTYVDGAGAPLLEAWLVHGLSHNYSGGSYAGTFTDPYGPDITGAAWAFFEAVTEG